MGGHDFPAAQHPGGHGRFLQRPSGLCSRKSLRIVTGHRGLTAMGILILTPGWIRCCSFARWRLSKRPYSGWPVRPEAEIRQRAQQLRRDLEGLDRPVAGPLPGAGPPAALGLPSGLWLPRPQIPLGPAQRPLGARGARDRRPMESFRCPPSPTPRLGDALGRGAPAGSAGRTAKAWRAPSSVPHLRKPAHRRAITSRRCSRTLKRSASPSIDSVHFECDGAGWPRSLGTNIIRDRDVFATLAGRKPRIRFA
jgi:hypothetical protein